MFQISKTQPSKIKTLLMMILFAIAIGVGSCGQQNKPKTYPKDNSKCFSINNLCFGKSISICGYNVSHEELKEIDDAYCFINPQDFSGKIIISCSTGDTNLGCCNENDYIIKKKETLKYCDKISGINSSNNLLWGEYILKNQLTLVYYDLKPRDQRVMEDLIKSILNQIK